MFRLCAIVPCSRDLTAANVTPRLRAASIPGHPSPPRCALKNLHSVDIRGAIQVYPGAKRLMKRSVAGVRSLVPIHAAGLLAAKGGELLGGPAIGFRALASFKRRAACTMCTT